MNNYAIIVDCGNTNTSIGIFKEHKFYARIDIPSSKESIENSFDKIIEFKKKYHLYNDDVKGGLISSVVPFLNNVIVTLIKNSFGIVLPIMDQNYKFDIEVTADDPSEIGADLLADSIAGKKLLNCPALIIDLGTIAKIIVLDENKRFIGTSFFPGLEVCQKAMKEKTALLPDVNLTKKPNNVLGNNSINAMESGLYYGLLGFIKTNAELVTKMFNKPVSKILTGGNAKLFENDVKDFVIDENFVLKGIYLIYLDN